MATQDPNKDSVAGGESAPNPPAQPPPPAPKPAPVQTPGGAIDPKSVLLPKKEVPGHTAASAQRVNAGILLEQETGAQLPHTPPKAPPAPPQPKKEASVVRALETYQGDIESLVQKQNVSVVSIAAAQAERRSQPPQASAQPEPAASPFIDWLNMLGSRLAMVVGGGLLIAVAAGLLAFIIFKPVPSVSINGATPAPFILVDGTKGIAFEPDRLTHATLMSALQGLRNDTALTVGLIGRLYPATVTTNADDSDVYTLINAKQLLSLMGPTAPTELVRTVEEEPYLLGVHIFDGPQAFLILTVDSYEQAFAGMLRWEATMRGDLGTLFARMLRPHIPEEGAGAATSSTPSGGPIQTGFVDEVVENLDTRVVKNEYGDRLLLWTLLNRSTLVITTNEYTLREILTRLTNAPVTVPR